jgi:hypothetical protein
VKLNIPALKKRLPFRWAPKYKMAIFLKTALDNLDYIAVIYGDHLPK